MKLYKYHSINDYLIESLLKKRNWFARIKNLNDPFELYFNDLTESTIYDQFKESICVCCFSKNRNEILMWSHYAAGHTGVSLEFEFNEPAKRGGYFEIEYDDDILTLNEIKLLESGDLSLNVKTNGKFMTQKFSKWSYEQEIRLMHIEDDLSKEGLSKEYPGELTGIYFGNRSDNIQINQIKSVTQGLYDNLKFYKVDLDQKTMKMDLIT